MNKPYADVIEARFGDARVNGINLKSLSPVCDYPRMRRGQELVFLGHRVLRPAALEADIFRTAAWIGIEEPLEHEQLDPRHVVPFDVPSQPDDSNNTLFSLLAAHWEQETSFEASLPRMFMHPAYQEIIRMGEAVISPLLQGLDEPDPQRWFWALQAITRVNPVPAGASVEDAVATWHAWGEAQGYA